MIQRPSFNPAIGNIDSLFGRSADRDADKHASAIHLFDASGARSNPRPAYPEINDPTSPQRSSIRYSTVAVFGVDR